MRFIKNIELRKHFLLLALPLFFINFTADAQIIDQQGPADKATYLAEITTILKKKWPENRAINICCHGHSVPAGYANELIVDTFNAYPHLLHKGLKEQFPFAVINVIVTSIGGENAAHGAPRFEKDVLSHNPDIITIDYAINDQRTGIELVDKSWTSMIEKALAKNIKVILLTPTPTIFANLDDPDGSLNKRAQLIMELAGQYNIGLVDSLQEFKDFLDNGGKLQDIMSSTHHPNRKGHEIVTAQLLSWFQN